MSKPDIETLTSKVVYRNRWMTVREDQVRRRDGSEGIYGVVEKANFVAIAAIQDGRIHLVEQYRYPVRQRFWELPQGAWHDAPDTDAETVARGELQEETGLTAGEMIYAGEFCLAYGFSDHRCRLFLARGLTQGERRLDAEEQDMITRSFPLAEMDRMMLDGTIQDAVTIAGTGLLRLKGLI